MPAGCGEMAVVLVETIEEKWGLLGLAVQRELQRQWEGAPAEEARSWVPWAGEPNSTTTLEKGATPAAES